MLIGHILACCRNGSRIQKCDERQVLPGTTAGCSRRLAFSVTLHPIWVSLAHCMWGLWTEAFLHYSASLLVVVAFVSAQAASLTGELRINRRSVEKLESR